MTEETLFHLALETPPAAREELLDQLCRGDLSLRRRLAALIEAHDNPCSFLLHPPSAIAEHLAEGHRPEGGSAAPPSTRHAPGPGSSVGPYRLLRQIGEGGMGAVFMAEQTQPVRRVVALKLIKLGMDSRQVVARFEAERQALAMMDHPNIARVFDAGASESGHPYFVMELVNGVPITAFCGEARLGLRGRLELFVSVCQAVQHAHTKGVIHRDLKPGNVLVARYDGRPVVKVIDFGVAKATGPALTGPTLFTEFGAIVGTLEYMAPEQAELNQLDVDTRSDVYSLGALLYQLLTGTTPFERKRLQEAGLVEMLRIIREEEPPRPSTRLGADARRRAGLVRGELDWIVMRALDKDRDRRYQTASSLAEDVQRYLNDEPVRAGPPSAGYRLRKLLWRHRRGLATATALLAGGLLAAGSVGWVVRDRAVRLATTERAVELALTEAGLHHQEGKGPEAIAAVGRAEALLVAGDAGERMHRRVREWRANLDLARKLEDIRLQHGVEPSPDLGRARTAAPKPQQGPAPPAELDGDFDLALVEMSYRQAFHDFGLDLRVQGQEEAAQLIRASLVKEQILAALHDWAWWKLSLQRPGWERLLELARKADSDPCRERYLTAFLRKDHDALREMARDKQVSDLPPPTVLLLSRALKQIQEVPLAREMCRRAQRRHPGDVWLNLETAVYCLAAPSKEEAVGYLRAFLALRPHSASAHTSFAFYMTQLGRLPEAEAALDEAVRIHPNSAEAYRQLGMVRVSQQRLPDAAAAFRKVIELRPDYASAHCQLGRTLQRMGELKAGLEAIRRGHALGRAGEDWYQVSAEWLRQAERMVELEPTLASVLRGEGFSGDARDRLVLADLCCKKRCHAASARFFLEAFALDPKLATNPNLNHRYNAACGAVLAAGGQGEDAGTLTDLERADFRRHALDWLREELACARAMLESDPEWLARTMRYWQDDPDFLAVREEQAQAVLPESERAGWRRLWQDVEALRQKALGALRK